MTRKWECGYVRVFWGWGQACVHGCKRGLQPKTLLPILNHPSPLTGSWRRAPLNPGPGHMGNHWYVHSQWWHSELSGKQHTFQISFEDYQTVKSGPTSRRLHPGEVKTTGYSEGRPFSYQLHQLHGYLLPEIYLPFTFTPCPQLFPLKPQRVSLLTFPVQDFKTPLHTQSLFHIKFPEFPHNLILACTQHSDPSLLDACSLVHIPHKIGNAEP